MAHKGQTVSAEARAQISASQKARWAKLRQAQADDQASQTQPIEVIAPQEIEKSLWQKVKDLFNAR